MICLTNSIYTWSPWKPTNTNGLEFIPMLWGEKQVSDFTNLVVAGYANTVLALNESVFSCYLHGSWAN